MRIFARPAAHILLLGLCFATALSGCAPERVPAGPSAPAAPVEMRVMATEEPEATPAPTPAPVLKYIFLFIGDGMGPEQVSVTNGALAALPGEPLSFTGFPVRGELITNNAAGETTDSAAAATAISTGVKTANGMLGLDPDGVRLTNIAETLRGRGMRIGILTTVSLDHATPAGFYAHNASRTSYAAIADDLFASGFDYFAGGGFHGDRDNAALAKKGGFVLATGEAEANAAPEGGGLVCTGDSLKGDRGLQMAADGAVDGREGLLARNLSRGVARLTGDNGFFMMTEGGRIDVACHYHDAGGMYREMLDLDQAVRLAVDFYNAHPGETLILVTADHETGDLQLSGGTPAALSKQAVSCDRFDEVNVPAFRKSKTAFQDVLPEIAAAFGLDDLTEEETAYLRAAYGHTISDDLSGKELVKQYGYYEAVTSAAANLVAGRAGMTFRSGGHSARNVSIYAMGPGADLFTGVHENTFVHDGVLEALDAWGMH